MNRAGSTYPAPPESDREVAPWRTGSVQDRRTKLQLRRRMLLISLPLLLLVLLLAGKTLSVAIASAQLESAFARGDAAGVHAAAGVLKVANVIEPYKAWFNDGDGYVLSGDFESAKPEFERALLLAPVAQSCQVRVNLVLTLEKLADVKRGSGEPSAAQSLYAQGLKVVDAAAQGCFQDGSSGNQQGEGHELRDAKIRLQQKSEQAQPDQTGQDPAPTDPKQTPDSSKLDQLNRQNQDAQKDRKDGTQIRDGAGNPVPFDPNAKQW